VRGSTLCIGCECRILDGGEVTHVCTTKNDQNTVHSTDPSARAPKVVDRSTPAASIAVGNDLRWICRWWLGGAQPAR
jgi:hypothetical protein